MQKRRYHQGVERIKAISTSAKIRGMIKIESFNFIIYCILHFNFHFIQQLIRFRLIFSSDLKMIFLGISESSFAKDRLLPKKLQNRILYICRMLVTARGLEKSYGDLKVLEGIDLDIEAGEIVSIVGASGAGKSTLLHMLGTLDQPDKGRISIKEIEIQALKGKNLAAFRNKHIGFIFQFHQLLPEFTALENVCMPALILGKSMVEATQRALELLDILGMRARQDHKPSQLSGGEQQRIAIARALMNDPYLILADEPSGNLDSANAKALHSLFFELRDRLKQTFVIVTHNEELAAMADRKLTMTDGKISGITVGK